MKLTWTGLAYRSMWELDRRSGFKALRTPRGSVPVPSAVPSHTRWWGALGAGHRLRRLAASPPPVLWAPAGPPAELDWHLESNSQQHWPAREHWTRAIDAGAGDLRLTWERNRFAHVWEWVADGAPRAEEFATQVADWRRHNAFRSGVNWASGQELAVRSLAWLAGAAAYGGEFDDPAWQDLVELLYWHGVHIESEFGLARHAVRNNHLIAEGLGLAALGDSFGCFDEANRWKWRGLEAIEDAVATQFFDDGGYCQCSHAYHHFALQLLIEAWDWFEELRGILTPVFERSQRYFEAIVEDAGVPNFGPNDRVLAPDFDALLAALSERTRLDRRSAPTFASFPYAGLHVFRHDETTATLRCGELPDRAGHDDGLHVEVWFGGVPFAIDAGSFLYHHPTSDWFERAASHNVCCVDAHDPRERIARFTWDRVAHPWLVEADPRRRRALARYDEAVVDATWEREVRVDAAVEVRDTLNDLRDEDRRLQVHWLLDAPRDEVEVHADIESFTWNISTPTGSMQLVAEPLVGPLAGPRLDVEAAHASPTYGATTDVTSVRLVVVGRAVRFRTRLERR